MFNKPLSLLLLLCLFAAPLTAAAEELFINNRPFEGPVEGYGEGLQVGLEAISQALGLTLRRSGLGWLATVEPESEQGADLCDSNRVVVEGVVVEIAHGVEGPMVSLARFIEPLAYEMVPNPTLGVIDLNSTEKGGMGLTLSSKGMQGPMKATMRYFEAFRHFPAFHKLGDFRDQSRLAKGFRDMFNEMKQVVVPSFRERLEERQQALSQRLRDVARAFNRVSDERIEREFARRPRLKNFMDRFIAWTAGVSWSRPHKIDEISNDGHRAVVKVTFPLRHVMRDHVEYHEVNVELVKYGDEWLIESVGGQQAGSALPKF